MRNCYLLAVGVDKFANPDLAPLQYSSNDAGCFFDLINSIYDTKPECACLLTNESASYNLVHSALYSVFSKLSSHEDTIFFYFSGHCRINYSDYTGHLALYNRRGDLLGIDLRELRALTEESYANIVICFIDACQSGAIGQERHSFSSKSIIYKFPVSNTSSSFSRIIITSSPSSSDVKESEKYKLSYFTHNLIDIVKRHVSRRNALTISQLFDELSYALEAENQPQPVRFGCEYGRTYIIGNQFQMRSFENQSKSTTAPIIPQWLKKELSLPTRYPLSDDDTAFVEDINYPDGSRLYIGERIVKTWAIKNAGKRSWINRFIKCHGVIRGTGIIEVPPVVPIKDTSPGEIVNISVPMKMPSYPGSVHSYFKMIDSSGDLCFPDRKGLYVSFNIINR